MSTTPISYKPSSLFSLSLSSHFKSRKPISFHKFPTSKPLLFGGFSSVRSVFEEKGFSRPKTMTELTTIAAFRNGESDENFGVIEKEAILSSGSLKFHQEFMSGGLESTLNRMSKWLVAALFGAVVLLRHDSEALWAAMGSVINAWLSIALKRVFKQDRPVSASKTDHGMPSSHAQSIFFTVTFAILSMVQWLGINERTVTIGVLALACGSYLSWLRVSQQLHTISQIVVGASIGSIFSILWFWSWDAIVFKAFISSIWVRIVVVLGGIGFCLGFLLFVIQHWLQDEE